MNIQPVKNIIPTILEWAKKQTPNYDVCWWFDGGRDYWFPFDFHMVDGSVIVTKDMISEDVEYHMFQKVVGI